MTEDHPTTKEQLGLKVFQEGPVLSEINFLKYPFALLSNNNLNNLLVDAAKDKQTHIVCELKDKHGNKRVWKVSPSVTTGYTRPFDRKVFFTVLKLITDEQFPPPRVWKLGSLRRVCQVMKMKEAGANKKLIKESLVRLSSSTIYTECFRLKDEEGGDKYWKDKKESIGGNFKLWSVYWKGKPLPNGETADAIYLIFDEPFILSLKAYYVKPLDYEYWLDLPPLAQRIYELTGLKFFGLSDSEYVCFDYREFCQLLPIEEQTHFSNAKQVLDRAHSILKDTWWLKDVEWRGRHTGELASDGSWSLVYYPGPRALKEATLAREGRMRFEHSQARPALLPLNEDWLAEVGALVAEIERVTGDTHSRPAFTKIAKKLPTQLVWRWISETKVDYVRGDLEIKKSAAAIFMDKARRYCQERNLDIGINFKHAKQ